MRPLVLAIAFLTLLAQDQAMAQDVVADLKINDLLEPIRKQHNLPAMAGAIVTSKGLDVAGAVGMRKAGEDVPVTVNDLWHLGSNTKAMTAVVIAALVEEDKLHWDSSLADVFPELAGELSPEFRQVTLLQLLSHRAGLPHDLTWQKFMFAGNPLNARLAAVKEAGSLKLLSAPGEKYEYSNVGYVIAGAMAEKVTGQSWEELITTKVFKPLGMQTAGFGGVGSPGKLDQPWWHGPGATPAPFRSDWMDNPEVVGPAGTVHCSIADWAKFVADQLRGSRGEAALLKPETYKFLHTAPFNGDYALGWMLRERPWGGGTVLAHSGSNTMNYAIVWMAPKRDFAVLTCTNEGGEDTMKACDEAASALILYHVNQKN
jgi:CubicO group peptidase (beta-lactamase class C family)